MRNIFIITRHAASQSWILANLPFKTHDANVILQQRADFSDFKTDDVVVGVLPIKIISEICAKGGLFFALDISVPDELRGTELSAEILLDCSPKLQQYFVSSC